MMRAFFSVLLVAVSGLLLVRAVNFKCYYSGGDNETGGPFNCSTSGCCVEGEDDRITHELKSWKQDCNGGQQTEKCKYDPGLPGEVCCCDEPLCNDVNSSIWKMAINRQKCHVGETKSSSCGQPVPAAPESKRCEHDKFGCSVTVEGERSAVKIKYDCVEKCDEQKPCGNEASGYKCCCVGNKCNDEELAKSALDTFCPTTTPTSAAGDKHLGCQMCVVQAALVVLIYLYLLFTLLI